MDKPLTISASNSTVSSSSSSSNCNAATITPNMDDNALLLTNRYDEYAGDATDAEYALDYYVPKRSFIVRFPVAMDDFFRTVDDGVYSCLERIFLLPRCRPCSYWISVVVTSLTSVEVGICCNIHTLRHGGV